MSTISDRITDARAVLDVLARVEKVKFEDKQVRIDLILRVMHTEAINRLAAAIELPQPQRPVVGGRMQTIHDWKVAHPKQALWLETSPDPFAQSLLNGLNTFGSLTPKQQEALDKIVKEKKP